MILPLAFPAVVAGSIFTFSLTLGDYIAPGLITSEQFIGTVIYRTSAAEACPRPPRSRWSRSSVMIVYLLVAERLRRVRVPVRRDGRVAAHADAPAARRAVRRSRSSTCPLVVIALYAFNENITQTWPIEHYTTKWFAVA